MAALGPALFGRLAQGPPPPPISDLLLPPPAPLPPAAVPPPEPPTPPEAPAPPAGAAANAPFSIQTIGVDIPTGLPVPPPPSPPTAPTNHDTVVVEVTMTPTTTPPAAPTAAAVIPATPLPAPPSTEKEEGDEKGPGRNKNPGECRLMGPFAIFVQLGLGGLALLSLVYKRWRERPQRPVKIWFFDVSKQVFGSVLVHVANVFMSLLTSGRFSIKLEPGVVATATTLLRRDGAGGGGDDPYVPNPCSFYLLNLAIDTTLGIPILIFLLRLATAVVAYTPFGQPPESIQSGNYGHPPNAWWWLKQSLLYFCGLFGMKLCVLGIFLMLPWISRVGDWALSWTEGNEQLQIVFVMMLFPLIMNALQYYIIDSFIKEQTPSAHHHHGHHHHEGAGLYDHLSDSADDEESEEDDGDDEAEFDVYSPTADGQTRGDDEVARKAGDAKSVPKASEATGAPSTTTPPVVAPDVDYDPKLDGDSPTVIGSSSSRRSQRGSPAAGGGAEAPVPKELYPPE